jgi:hypothetical protein
MEQVPHIAMYCQEVPELLHHVVPAHLLPLVVKFLTDSNNQASGAFQAGQAYTKFFTRMNCTRTYYIHPPPPQPRLSANLIGGLEGGGDVKEKEERAKIREMKSKRVKKCKNCKSCATSGKGAWGEGRPLDFTSLALILMRSSGYSYLL